jgi:LysR family transcriptional regulator, hydrogen peroxide-inducible genes activator
MNLRDLEYFVAVAEEGHFGKAAHRCFVSQPTLSGQLRKLEEELGGPLIERNTRSVRLTSLGEEVLAEARKVQLSVQRITDLGAAHADPLHGSLRMGAFPTLGPWWLPQSVAHLQQKLPGMRFWFHELRTPELIAKLRSGELDCAFLAEPDGNDLAGEAIAFEPFYLLVPEQHALAERQSVRSEELATLELLLLEEGHCLRDEVLDLCRRFGAREDGQYRGTGIETLRQTVRLGAGVTLMPALAVADDPGPGLRAIPFSDPVPGRYVALRWRPTHPRQEALQLIAQEMREWAGRQKSLRVSC